MNFRFVSAFFGVFGMGVAFGYLMPQLYPKQSHLDSFMQKTLAPKDMASRIAEKFTAKFQLSSQEQAAIEPVLNDMTQTLYEDRINFGNKALGDEDAYHTKIAAVMTPEHRALFEDSYKVFRAKLAADLLVQPNPPEKSP